MKVLLLLVIFGTLAALIAWRASRSWLQHRARQRHIAELEAADAQLDDLIARQSQHKAPWSGADR